MNAKGTRNQIEGFASRHAALRISEGASPRSLLDCFRRMQQATERGDHRRFAASDRALHQTIVELADVPGLAPAWRAAFRTQQAFRMQTLRACWPDLSVLCEAHRALVDAVAAGTPEDVAAVPGSYTGRFLADVVKPAAKKGGGGRRRSGGGSRSKVPAAA